MLDEITKNVDVYVKRKYKRIHLQGYVAKSQPCP